MPCWLCGSQVSQMGMTIGCSLSLEACIMPFGAMKASPQEGSLRVTSSPDPLSNMHGVFSNGDLPCTPGEGGNQGQQ